MNKSIIFFILLISVFLQSCMLSAPANSRRSLLNTNLNTNNVNVPVLPANFAADEINPYWFDTAKIIGVMTVNSNTQNIYYLRGKNIHDFLSAASTSTTYNYQKTFCIKMDFNNPTYYSPLWVRAIPLAISNFTTQSVERVLRVDIPNATDNSAACGQAALVQAAYSPTNICTPASTCTGKITAQTMSLATVSAGVTTLVPLTSVDLNSAKLQIDLQSNGSSTTSLCDNTSCGAKGFDCCIEGQCVKDATQKSSAQNNMTEYNQAMTEYKANPLSFINWPNVFYICSNISHAPPPITPPTTTNPISDAQTRVKTYLSSYQCVSDVQALLGYARCSVSALTSPPLGLSQDPAYQFIKKSLARSCGCNAIDSEMALKCPDWGVRPLYSSSVQIESNIVDFYCYTPTPPSQFGPIVNLDVAVPNRTAPHRLYTTDGTNYNLITDMPKVTPAPVQEGVAFNYIDELNKMSPNNGIVNINSVLGSMSVDLNHTLPAKMVNVELGKAYLLTAKSGFYTPCPKCARDTWYQNFFPFAPSKNGVGLQAIGYTTSRDTYADNTTLGNYEDSRFGRACYVPVTMLPFAHNKNNSLQVQRQNRLRTQAAYYINGYQRDWFGFNQGALIGSFDGVTWFAIGKGRRITATSTKLFLAINAAFLDLADKTDTIVNIVPDSINNIVSDYDYDTTLALNDARQNQGGTCQKYHQCANDTDCITQLGWEYVCADVSQYTTKWPVTNADGVEQLNKETTASLFEILASTTDTRSSFRCVYRGAGAPCKGDAPVSNTVINSLNKKLFTCAPNFYCARTDGNYFNNELVRSPNEPTNFLYGFEANVLGRPLNYVTANQPLPAEVIENIKSNALATIIPNTVSPTTVSDMGICRPGKSMVDPALATLAQRHGLTPDIKKRTDYISQIGNCDSTSTVIATRFMNCPVIDTDSTPGNLNYLNYKPEDLTSAATRASYSNQAATQNSCGQEAKYIHTVSGNVVNESSFKYIEAGFLDKITGISYPMLAQDACLRRAGSVCNTDLDCGPNLMHEQAAATITKDAFGGTAAEQSYWSESLICSQGAPKPLTSSPDYSKYQLNQNRCCRDIGKDFTMYTQGYDPLGVNIPKSGTAFSTSRFSYANPSTDGRYSRYSVSSTAQLTTAIDTSASAAKTAGTSAGTGLASIPAINNAATAQPNNYQWKVFGETGKNTCCGGGFVRKFADGTHDWNKQGRLSIDTSNFKCLNYRSPLMFDPLNNLFSNLSIRQISYEYEYNYLCNSPANSADLTKQGCLQIPYPADTNKSEFTIIHPVVYDEMQGQTPSLGVGSAQRAGDGSGVLNIGPSILPAPSGWAIDQVNTNAPFQPTYVGQYPAPGSNPVTMVNSNYVKDSKYNYGFAVYLPTYIQNSCSGGTAAFNNACVHDAIKRVIITYLDASGNQITSSPTLTPAATGSDTAATPTDSTDVPMMSAGNTCKILADGVSPDKHIHPFTYDNMVDAGRLAPSLQSKHFDTEAWCIDSSPADGTAADKFKNGQPILLVKAKNQRDLLSGGGGDTFRYDMAVLEIHFKTIEEIRGTKLAVPGNSNYYLTKLGRLELLGIPQITYEPIYCNSDQGKVVEGIFKKVIPPLTQTLTSRADFNGGNTNVHTYSYTPEKMYSSDLATDAGIPTINTARGQTPAGAILNIGNQEKKFVYQDQVDHPAIFSDKDFTCCTPLGKTPKTGTIAGCCSGYGVIVGSKLICKLPIGTDLNVYFNRFVSNEGVGDNLTGANGALGLNDSGIEPDSDFIPQTGEPKFRDSTASKIYGLGVAYCDRGKVTNGGAFGQFAPEPGRWGSSQNNPVSIVDSPNDTAAGGGGGTYDRTNNRYLGKQGFDFGVRWNHHYYCSQ